MSGHGVATTSTASADTGDPETAHPRPATASVIGKKTTAGSIGDPGGRRPVGLGPLDELHDARVRRRRCRPQRRSVDRLSDDARPAADLVAGLTENRQWLSRQRGFLEHGTRTGQRAVDRDDLAGQHAQRITGRHIARRDVDETAVLIAMCHHRSALRQSGELATGAAECPLVEQFATRQHQRDDQARRILAKDQRARDRQERDDIRTELPAQHATDDRDRERHDHGNERPRPEGICRVGFAHEPEHEPAREGERDTRGKQHVPHAHRVKNEARADIGGGRRAIE